MKEQSDLGLHCCAKNLSVQIIKFFYSVSGLTKSSFNIVRCTYLVILSFERYKKPLYMKLLEKKKKDFCLHFRLIF